MSIFFLVIIISDSYSADFKNVNSYLPDHIEYFEDKSLKVDINDINKKYLDKFIISEKSVPNFGFTESAYWLKFNIKNLPDNEWYMELGFSRLNDVTLYIPEDNGYLIKKSGIIKRINQREIKSRKIVFPLPQNLSNKTIFLRVYSPKSAMQIPITLWNKTTFWENSVNEESFFNICYGILLVLVLYNFLIFLILKEKSYFYYCIFGFGAVLHQFSINGHGYYYLWPSFTDFDIVSPWLFTGIEIFGFDIFIAEFLDLRNNKKLNKLFKFLAIAAVIQTLLLPFYFNPTLISYLILIFAIFLFVPTLIYLIKRDESYIKVIFIAWMAFSIGTGVFLCSRLGLIEKTFLTDNILLITLCSANIIISLALAEKFKLYKDEKNKYYKQLEAANEELSNYQTHLEQLVKEKTFELEEAKSEAENMAKIKSDFLAVMSHEIRTPINAVMGMTELLSLTKMDNEQNYFVKTIMSSSEILLNLINDILDMSKIESGKMELEKREFLIKNCLEEVIDILASKAHEKGLDIFYNIESNVPKQIISDSNKLKRILINLIGNAIKFTEKGEITINVGLNYLHKGYCDLLFSVKDTGIGIPEDKRNRVFKSFSQVDSSVSRKFGGSGLGLNISKNIVEAMKGKISFENNSESSGTTFSFNIKVEYIGNENHNNHSMLSGKKVFIESTNKEFKNIIQKYCLNFGIDSYDSDNPQKSGNYDLYIIYDDSQVKLSSEIIKDIPVLIFNDLNNLNYNKMFYLPKPLKIDGFSNLITQSLNYSVNQLKEPINKVYQPNSRLSSEYPLKILVAEDNKVNQKLIEKVFQKLGYRIDIVNNGLEAINICQEKTYDIIFMDIQMPEVDGIEATKTIKANLQDKSPIIIALTANVLEEQKNICLEAGMSKFLTKPFKINDIESIVISLANK